MHVLCERCRAMLDLEATKNREIPDQQHWWRLTHQTSYQIRCGFLYDMKFTVIHWGGRSLKATAITKEEQPDTIGDIAGPHARPLFGLFQFYPQPPTHHTGSADASHRSRTSSRSRTPHEMTIQAWIQVHSRSPSCSICTTLV